MKIAHTKNAHAWRRLSAGLSAALLLATVSVPAQEYRMAWSSVDGGGGFSAGGGFVLGGSIGQPDAGIMNGGGFTLQGGFWGIVAAVQNPPAPFLSVVRTATNGVVVSWPGPEAGWCLQATTSLSTTPIRWVEIPPPYTVVSTNLVCIEPLPPGNRFYRLHKP